MEPFILLLGKSDSENIRCLAQYCEQNQHPYAIFDTDTFGKSSFLSRDHDHDLTLHLPDLDLDVSDICGIYWDRISLPNAEQGDSINIASMLQVFFTQTQLNWVNSWQAFQFHKTKPSQLLLAETLGANIPETYIGNDPVTAQIFVDEQTPCIIKPLHGGQLSEFVDPNDIQKLKDKLTLSPVTIQQYIAGTNVRTFVIGNTLYSAQIDSQNVDFRQNGNIELTPIKVPRHIEVLAVRIMRAFHMQWTAMDWRVTEHGEYVFLEANPAPMFAEFERCTGYPITKALLALLSKRAHMPKNDWGLVDRAFANSEWRRQ